MSEKSIPDISPDARSYPSVSQTSDSSSPSVSLNELQWNAFKKILKKGIFKEMHQKKLLTDEQLDYLLNREMDL